MRKLFNLLAILVAVFALQTFVAAQTAPGTDAPFGRGERVGRLRGGHHGGGRILRAFSQLNLTETQQEQIKTIRETYAAANSAKRQELRAITVQFEQGTILTVEQQTRARELREQIRTATEKVYTDSFAVLTAEQRTQLEQLQADRKQRRGLRRGKRGGDAPQPEIN